MFWRWAIFILLIIVGLLFLNAAVSYFWAAGVSSGADRGPYLRNAYIDLALTVLFLISAAVMLVKNTRRLRKTEDRPGHANKD